MQNEQRCDFWRKVNMDELIWESLSLTLALSLSTLVHTNHFTYASHISSDACSNPFRTSNNLFKNNNTQLNYNSNQLNNDKKYQLSAAVRRND